MRKILITRPEHDDTTHYLSKWARKNIELAKSKNIKVLDLNKGKANKSNTMSMLRKQEPSLVIFNGHGNVDRVTGHENEVLIDPFSAKALKNKVVYAISCKSAKKLGQKSVEQGAQAYIGYNDDFIFLYNPLMISKPLEDHLAKYFMEPNVELTNSLIKGNKASTACERSTNCFKKHIHKLMSSESNDSDLVKYLWWDMNHQVLHGNKDAVF